MYLNYVWLFIFDLVKGLWGLISMLKVDVKNENIDEWVMKDGDQVDHRPQKSYPVKLEIINKERIVIRWQK